MDYSELNVKSKYIKDTDVIFYIKNFRSIINILHLANNYNFYYLIITNETKDDLLNIKNHLSNNKKNPEFNKDNLIFLYLNEEQKKWCDEYEFNSKFNDEKIIFDDYIPIKLNSPPHWAFSKKCAFLNYYDDGNIKIIHLEGLDHNWNILHLLKNNIYTLITWPCFVNKWLYEQGSNALFTLNNNYNKKNIIWLCPDLDTILFAYEYGFNAIFANQNCLLDENIFNINENEEKIYNMVMNCRPELIKRPYLAKNIDNLAYIKGATYNNKEKYNYNELNCKFINENRIDPEMVNLIYNKSYCAGIFSELEGACYSSSEYLLCGLPVISTFSKGGRDTWYNNENSIIVKDNQDAVSEAVSICIGNLKSGIFKSENIRNNHIKMSNIMRENIIKCTKYIFDLHNITIDEKYYWEKKFFHKFIKYVDLIEVKKILS